MTKKRIILIFAVMLLTVIPVSTVEIPHEAYAKESVLGTTKTTATVAVAKTTATTTPKPAVAKKPVAKKKVVAKKKAPAKKKERLIAAPPMITAQTAPGGGR